MNEAARAKAEMVVDRCVLSGGLTIGAMQEVVAEALDAFATEQTAVLQRELALAQDTTFWLDCRWKTSAEGPRSATTCALEGTHVCARCLLADSEAQMATLRAALRQEHENTLHTSPAAHKEMVDRGMKCKVCALLAEPAAEQRRQG